MPKNLADPGTYLVDQQWHVMPLLALFDDSEFSREAKRAWDKTIEAPFKAATLVGSVTNAETLVGEVAVPGFTQRLGSLRRWPHQRCWCVWFFGSDDTSPEKVVRQIQSYRANQAVPVDHLCVIRIKDATRWRGWQEATSLPAVEAVFLVSENGSARRELPVMADAAVAHIYCSWKRFCHVQDGNIGLALLLTPNHRVHALGTSYSAPDWVYHTARWSQRIEDESILEWQKEPGSAVVTSYEPSQESLRSLLPEETGTASHNYDVVGDDGLMNRSLVQIAGKRFCVIGEIAEKQNEGSRKSRSSRDELLDWLKAIKNLHHLLGFALLQNVNRVVRARIPALSHRWQEKTETQVTAEHPPRGFLKACQQRLNQAGAWCRENKNATIMDEEGRDSFDGNERVALKKIGAIPNPWGVILRLALSSVCLIWLMATPRFWMPKTIALQEQVAHNTLMGAVICVVLLAGLAMAHLYYYLLAVRAVERTRRDVIDQHFCDVGNSLVAQFANAAGILEKQVASWGKLFDALSSKLRENRAEKRSLPVNRTPFFHAESFDNLLRERLAAMIEDAHRKFLAGLSKPDFLQFDASQWRKLLSEQARATATQTIDLLSYEECIKARNATTQEKTRLLEDLITEARMPSVEIQASPNPSPVIVTADSTWENLVSGSPQPLFCNLPLQQMLAVAIIPVPND